MERKKAMKEISEKISGLYIKSEEVIKKRI